MMNPSPPFPSAFDAWLSSRAVQGAKGVYLLRGAQRTFTIVNLLSAYAILKLCILDLARALWKLHPRRTALMISLNLLRSLFPAFRGYSQALVIDEIQTSIISGRFTWTRLARLVVTEVLRRILESFLDSFAVANENLVYADARLFVEYRQMEHRLRLDLPTLEDPIVRDLLHESDMFARSFNGMGGFGLLSPFDFINILTLMSEFASHILVLKSLTGSIHYGALLLSLLSVFIPLLIRRFGISRYSRERPSSLQEIRSGERIEKLRSLAFSDEHRPEIILFGLGPWILRSWAVARKSTLGSDSDSTDLSLWESLLSNVNLADMLFALQNIPLVLVLQSSASLGSLTLYRSSIQSCLFTIQSLATTIRMTYQGVFLMGAFCAAFEIQPRLQPRIEETVDYRPSPTGLSIEVRHLSYTYPGSKNPSLKDVSFKLNAGERLAIVGHNGSGKTTLAKILLRILDFDEGELELNGVDIRKINIADYHRRVTAVFQGFSKFNATVKENVGVGYVENLGSTTAVEHSIRLAGAQTIVNALPRGLRTKLGPTGYEFVLQGPSMDASAHARHGLSGGEWQRIAISRAFMRANQPEVELLLFDEPTSSLDAHAQNSVFDTIQALSQSPSGERTKTVIFITHRLSTARRADKIAMMENGTISEFGSQEELMAKNGAYAALYRASV